MAVNKESRFCPHNDVVTVVKPLGDVNYTMALQQKVFQETLVITSFDLFSSFSLIITSLVVYNLIFHLMC